MPSSPDAEDGTEGNNTEADHTHACRDCGGTVVCGLTESQCERSSGFTGTCKNCSTPVPTTCTE